MPFRFLKTFCILENLFCSFQFRRLAVVVVADCFTLRFQNLMALETPDGDRDEVAVGGGEAVKTFIRKTGFFKSPTFSPSKNFAT